jgi:predicted metal-dependent HD superfamily phosphohydrolase
MMKVFSEIMLRGQLFSCLSQEGVLITKLNNLSNKLLTYYKDPKRSYHTIKHIIELLDYLDLFPNLENRNIFVLAIIFHDIIYSVNRDDNEELSVEFFKSSMNEINYHDKDVIDQVSSWILATKTHENDTGDYDCLFFLDMDMAILGSESNRYEEYCDQVYQEYVTNGGVDPERYVEGRKKFLNGVLKSEQIFKTPLFNRLFENTARQNIERELEKLNK